MINIATNLLFYPINIIHQTLHTELNSINQLTSLLVIDKGFSAKQAASLMIARAGLPPTIILSACLIKAVAA